MAKQNNKLNPRARLFHRKYIVGYNPKNPSNDLMELIRNTTLPKSGYLNTTMRGKPITELTIDELEYVGFDLRNGQDKLKMMCKLYYFIKLHTMLDTEGISEEDFDELVKDEFGGDEKDEINKVTKKPDIF